MLMGISRSSHCASVIWKLARDWARLGHALVLAARHAIKESGAGFAGANNLPHGNLHQVRMFLCNAGAAQLAALLRPLWAGELAERRERLVRSSRGSGGHG